MEVRPNFDIEALHLIPSSYEISVDVDDQNAETLTGYLELQKIRNKAREYRLGYINWRQNKPRGAKGEHQDVFTGVGAVSNLQPDDVIHLPGNEFSKIEAQVQENDPAPTTPTLSKCTELELSHSPDLHQNSCGSHITEDALDNNINTQQAQSTPKPEDPYCSFPVPQQLPMPSISRAPSFDGCSDDGNESHPKSTIHVKLAEDVQTQEIETHKDQEAESWVRFYFHPLTPVSAGTVWKLAVKTLSVLRSNVIIPRYNRAQSAVAEWIVHIGVGGFHRSHQAVYLDDILHKLQDAQLPEPEDNNSMRPAHLPPHYEHGVRNVHWGICGIGLTPADKRIAEVFQQQDMLYTVLTRTTSTNVARVVGCVYDFVYVPDNYQQAFLRLVDPHTRVVSLTVTEKGYCENTDGKLDVNNPLIKNDLGNLTAPRTAIGLIVAGLRLRMKQNTQPFTVLSCDNLPDNGHVLKRMVLEFAALIDQQLAAWIESHVCFPCTMVDRITPITGNEHKEILQRDFGIHDEWPVVAEEYRQWVIEDSFCNIRPPWEHVGVMLTLNVRPYEIMKLRLLNGGHSFLAYMSFLAGYRFVDDAVNNILISCSLRSYMDEVTSTITGVSIELERYKDKIVERFGNRFIKDSLARVAEDGSTKFFNTMKDAVKELVTEGRHVHFIALALAAWIMFLYESTTKPECSFPIKDPKAEVLQSLCLKLIEAKLTDSSYLVEIIENVFGPEPIFTGVFLNEILVALAALRMYGVHEVLKNGGPLHTMFRAKLKSMEGVQSLIEFAEQS